MKREKTQITTTGGETRGLTAEAAAVKGVRDPTDDTTLTNSATCKKQTNYSKPAHYHSSAKIE